MKKKVFGLLALVCTLVCSLFIVGCGEEPEPTPPPEETTYTVTFKNGDETVKTVTVDEGDALAAGDVPAAPAAEEGKFFDGWFAGNAEVSVGYTPTADVTANAAFTQGVSVTFKNGNETVKTVYVRPNTAVAEEDIPAAPVAEAGKFFDGWFVGNVNVNDTYLVEEDVTANAVFTQGVAVTFKNGSETITTVYVRPNAVLAEADIPADPTAETNFAFDAWVDGENNVVDLTEAAFEEDTEIFASFVRTAYTVTFVNGTDSTPVTVARGQDGFFLAAGDIPAAPAMESGHIFLGWYNAGVKAVGNLEITEDITFTAIDVCKANYVGTWVNDDTYAIITDTTFSAVGYSDETYTFDAETGALKFRGDGYFLEEVTFSLLGDTLKLVYHYYDSTYEEYPTDVYEFTKAQSFAYAGTYENQNGTELVIIDGGFVTDYYGSFYDGKMYQEGDNWFIKYKERESATVFVEKPVTVTAEGYIIINWESNGASANGVFMKDLSEKDEKDYVSGAFWNDDTTLYLYTCTLEDDTVVYVYRTDIMYYLATVDGTVASGNEVTLTLTGAPVSTVALKFYSAGLTGKLKFYERTDEAGTYTCAGQSDLVFDGYGNVTVGSNAATTYSLTENGIAVVYDEEYNFTGYKVDYSAKTYTVEAQDGTQATFVKYNGDYTMMLDGFGTVLQIKHSDSSVYHQGTYTVSESSGVKEITIEGAKYDSKVYTLYETGVLWYSKSVAYIKEGADVVTAQDYVGSQEGKYYFEQKTIVINVADKEITVNGTTTKSMTLCCNENGIYWTYSLSGTNTVTLGTEADTIVITNGSNSTTYTAGEPVAEEPEEPAVADAFLGKWENASRNDFYFDGYGKGIMYTDSAEVAITYTINDEGNRINFTADSISYTVYPKSGAENTLSVMAGSYMDIYDVTYVAPDAFVGTWTNDNKNENYNGYSFAFDGYGNVRVWYTGEYSSFDKTVEYTVSGNVATFEANWADWTCTYNEADGTLSIVTAPDGDGYTTMNATFTRVGGGTDLDAFAGTYVADSFTLTFDGAGNGTFNNGSADFTFTYTVDGTTANISAVGDVWNADDNTATLGDGTVTISWNDEYMENPLNKTFTKQA